MKLDPTCLVCKVISKAAFERSTIEQLSSLISFAVFVIPSSPECEEQPVGDIAWTMPEYF
jgi:hypothetical protein